MRREGRRAHLRKSSKQLRNWRLRARARRRVRRRGTGGQFGDQLGGRTLQHTYGPPSPFFFFFKLRVSGTPAKRNVPSSLGRLHSCGGELVKGRKRDAIGPGGIAKCNVVGTKTRPLEFPTFARVREKLSTAMGSSPKHIDLNVLAVSELNSILQLQAAFPLSHRPHFYSTLARLETPFLSLSLLCPTRLLLRLSRGLTAPIFEGNLGRYRGHQRGR
ncbi:hypothetical protein GQ53DRAFT_241854 [Thozetella sp. PMI_491]|nr:hypothetical protein GQ53DRAFT_241854 [Thozetella sp. PMI_491]